MALVANALCTGGTILLGIGGFYSEAYSQVLVATRSAGMALIACALGMLLGGGMAAAGRIACARGGHPRPWQATRRIAAILASLWTTGGIWMLAVQGPRFSGGTLNTPLVALLLPTAALWVITFTPPPSDQ